MTDHEIVITEKSSQAKDVRGAIGARYGTDPARPKATLSICSNRRMWSRSGSAGRRSC